MKTINYNFKIIYNKIHIKMKINLNILNQIEINQSLYVNYF